MASVPRAEAVSKWLSPTLSVCFFTSCPATGARCEVRPNVQPKQADDVCDGLPVRSALAQGRAEYWRPSDPLAQARPRVMCKLQCPLSCAQIILANTRDNKEEKRPPRGTTPEKGGFLGGGSLWGRAGLPEPTLVRRGWRQHPKITGLPALLLKGGTQAGMQRCPFKIGPNSRTSGELRPRQLDRRATCRPATLPCARTSSGATVQPSYLGFSGEL
jgi:hypothetical protein